MTDDAKRLALDLLAKYATPRPATVPVPQTRGAGSDLGDHPQIRTAADIRARLDARYRAAGLPSPYFLTHSGPNGATTEILGREMVNFSAYDYLGLAGHPRVVAAAKKALDDYGTSASASRVAGGEIPLYGELEHRLAETYRVDDAIVTSSGFLTNAGVIPFLLGPNDLAMCDALVHNSVVAGTRWAHCRRATFRHNDPVSLDTLLTRVRGQFDRVMVIVEGVYSMDGDVARLPEIIEVARRHGCLIMVDEAHALGTLGERGLGVREHFALPGDSVDIWMGTLSKTLASCGGYLAGSADLIWAIRLLAPGVCLFAAPPTPAQIAAAITAHDLMLAEPGRTARLRSNADTIRTSLTTRGWNTGTSADTPVIPILLGNTERTMDLADHFLAAGINAPPVVPPAVAEGEERIRLFVSAEHTAEHVRHLIAVLCEHREVGRRSGVSAP